MGFDIVKPPRVLETTSTYVRISHPSPTMNPAFGEYFTFYFDGTYVRSWAELHEVERWWICGDILMYAVNIDDTVGHRFFNDENAKYSGIYAKMILDAQADIVLLGIT